MERGKDVTGIFVVGGEARTGQEEQVRVGKFRI